jgi:serine/threonine-protein kinase
VTLKGRYRIVRSLGQGSSCRVYQAARLPSGDKVAIKVLVRVTPVGLARFRRELEIHKRLNHPNIVTLYDAGWLQNERPYLAMEYLEGASLENLLDNRGYLEARHIVSIAEGTAAGLAALHSAGFVHRDLKPSNIFIGRSAGEGRLIVKLIDFGLAKGLKNQIDVGVDDITLGGRVCGTPRYMAPEQVLGRGAEPASDIYSLGAVMWEMLCGEAPYPDPDPVNVMIQHVEEPLPDLDSRMPVPGSCPAPLRELMLTALQKRPEQRPIDGHAMLKKIRQVRRAMQLEKTSGVPSSAIVNVVTREDSEANET